MRFGYTYTFQKVTGPWDIGWALKYLLKCLKAKQDWRYKWEQVFSPHPSVVILVAVRLGWCPWGMSRVEHRRPLDQRCEQTEVEALSLSSGKHQPWVENAG